MEIIDMRCIPKKDKETEYDPVAGRERTIIIKRHNIGLLFEAELTFDEYYWVFGDRRPEKFNLAFESALYEFIRIELTEEENENERT